MARGIYHHTCYARTHAFHHAHTHKQAQTQTDTRTRVYAQIHAVIRVRARALMHPHTPGHTTHTHKPHTRVVGGLVGGASMARGIYHHTISFFVFLP